MTRLESLKNRLEKHSIVEPNTGCKIWLGHANSKNGRPYISVNRVAKIAYRVAWTIERGAIQDGLFVCHKCDNRLCINVNHLFVGTAQQNTDDAKAKGRLARGSKCRGAKINEEDVRDIRILHENKMNPSLIGSVYKISFSTVYDIIKGRTWAHVV